MVLSWISGAGWSVPGMGDIRAWLRGWRRAALGKYMDDSPDCDAALPRIWDCREHSRALRPKGSAPRGDVPSTWCDPRIRFFDSCQFDLCNRSRDCGERRRADFSQSRILDRPRDWMDGVRCRRGIGLRYRRPILEESVVWDSRRSGGRGVRGGTICAVR